MLNLSPIQLTSVSKFTLPDLGMNADKDDELMQIDTISTPIKSFDLIADKIEEKTCKICLDPFVCSSLNSTDENQLKYIKLDCKHLYHSNCLN